MAFLNFLGDIGSALEPGMSDSYGFDKGMSPPHLTGQVDPSLTANLPTPNPAPQHHGLFGGNWLGKLAGTIGDALLVANGLPAQYGPRMRQKKVGTALANYLGNTDAGLAEIFQEDPATGIALYKIQHPTNEVPAAMKEWQAYQQMDPDTQNRFRQFRQTMSPQFMSPVTLGQYDTIEGGGPVPSGPPQTAIDYLKQNPGLASQFDQKYGPGSAAKVLGGASPSSGSATFP